MTLRSTLSSNVVKTAVAMALSVGLLWLFFRGTDLASIRDSLARAELSLIGASVLMMLLTYFLRALRWKILLSPLGRASLMNCFVTTVVGFAVNFLVPSGRVGEIVRPYLLARKEGFSTSSAFATIFVERILDLVAVAVLLGGWIALVSRPNLSAGALGGLKIGGWIGLGGAAGAVAVLYVFARYPERALVWASRALAWLPDRARAAGLRFAETFAKGFGVLKDGRAFARAVAMSFAVWASIAFAFWLGASALGVTFPYVDTFPVIGFLTLGVLVPTPGAVGGYHYMCALALTSLFGTDDATAKAVALTNHGVSFLPVTFLGIFLLPKAGTSFGEVKSMDSSKPGDSEP